MWKTRIRKKTKGNDIWRKLEKLPESDITEELYRKIIKEIGISNLCEKKLNMISKCTNWRTANESMEKYRQEIWEKKVLSSRNEGMYVGRMTKWQSLLQNT